MKKTKPDWSLFVFFILIASPFLLFGAVVIFLTWAFASMIDPKDENFTQIVLERMFLGDFLPGTLCGSIFILPGMFLVVLGIKALLSKSDE